MTHPLIIATLMLTHFIPSTTAKIAVADLTIPLDSLQSKTLTYAFEEGDKVSFSLIEKNNAKTLALEITEYPNTLRFSEQAAAKIDKSIILSARAIWSFKITNQAHSPALCRLIIQRTPANPETRNFNTGVVWKTITDTIKSNEMGYKMDTTYETIVNQTIKISSRSAIGHTNYSTIDVNLPPNTQRYTYYIGVGKQNQDIYKSRIETVLSAGLAATSSIASNIPYIGKLTSLAASVGSNAALQVQGSDYINYFFADSANTTLIQQKSKFISLKQGKVVNEIGQLTAVPTTPFKLTLLNDNILIPIDVMVQVEAMVVQLKPDTSGQGVTKIIHSQRPVLMEYIH